MSKVSIGRELGIDVIFDQNMKLEHFPRDMDHHDFVLIIGNLIENAFAAFKHSEEDKKQVYLSIEQDDHTCTIVVEDNGCGIPVHIQHHIYERGFTTKGTEGSGIGLYLIAQIVNKSRGEISVQSAPNEGTSFILSFPMDDDKGEPT